MTVLVLFFVFKQKTAYEMRISDWSSDVCSSDLKVGGAPERLGGESQSPDEADDGHTGRLIIVDNGNRQVHRRPHFPLPRLLAAMRPALWRSRRTKIGRASCRERVCQSG